MRITSLIIVALVIPFVATPQGRPVDWPSYGGDARRSGWERSDTMITKENVKDFQLVLKRQLENPQGGPHSLTAPVVIGLLISYRGFKELGFVTNSVGDLWSIDVDLNRVFWKKRFERSSKKGISESAGCAEIATTPALTPPLLFGRRRPATTNTPSPGQPPTPAASTPPPKRPARLGGTGFGGPRPVYIIASDGKLHQVNTSDGSDQFPPLEFLPGSGRPLSLTLHDNVMYAATGNGCGGAPSAVWALDLAEEEPRVVSFPLKGGNPVGLGGFAVGNDGTVYVQTGPGQSDPASNQWSNTLLALSPKDLKLKGYFTSGDHNPKNPSPVPNATPVVFEYKGRDLVVSVTHDGRLTLLDSQNVGGSDHKTPLSQTVPVASAGGGIWGGVSAWDDGDGGKWVAAPVWGAVNPDLKFPVSNGAAPNGSVVTFKVEEKDGKPVLTPAWISRDLNSPVPPVITSGIVFALSTGGYALEGGALKPKSGARATLYAFDAATGKEMYSTGNQVSAPANLTGLTLANGRVFFTTADNVLYGFGIFLEI